VNDESEGREVTMSFTTVDVGFGAERYSFGGPDFGSLDFDDLVSDLDMPRVRRCATCGPDALNVICVACTDLEFIDALSLHSVEQVWDGPNLGMMTDTMGRADGDVPDSVGGEDGDVPDSIGGEDDEDESSDDGTESEGM
jgi:hypothetical protein